MSARVLSPNATPLYYAVGFSVQAAKPFMEDDSAAPQLVGLGKDMEGLIQKLKPKVPTFAN
jgi:hypothetical protein